MRTSRNYYAGIYTRSELTHLIWLERLKGAIALAVFMLLALHARESRDLSTKAKAPRPITIERPAPLSFYW